MSSCTSHRYCTASKASGVSPWIGGTHREGPRSPQEVLDPHEGAAGASVLRSPSVRDANGSTSPLMYVHRVLGLCVGLGIRELT